MINCKNNFGKFEDVDNSKFVFRPSVYGFVLKGNSVLLMKNKSNNKFWLPGGGVNLCETNFDALKREISEETGLILKTAEFLFFRENFFYYKPTDEAYHAFLFFYVCKIDSYDLIQDHKVDDLESFNPRFVDIESLKVDDFSDFSSDIFNYLQKFKK